MDLLIHEATYLPELQRRASQVSHSTLQDALHVALLTNAKTLLVTHFSRRHRLLDYLHQPEFNKSPKISLS